MGYILELRPPTDRVLIKIASFRNGYAAKGPSPWLHLGDHSTSIGSHGTWSQTIQMQLGHSGTLLAVVGGERGTQCISLYRSPDHFRVVGQLDSDQRNPIERS